MAFGRAFLVLALIVVVVMLMVFVAFALVASPAAGLAFGEQRGEGATGAGCVANGFAL